MKEFAFVALTLFASVAGVDYTPSSSDYLLEPVLKILKPLNWLPFDGPPYISSAPAKPTSNELPCLDDMKYYMYYAASTYYGYDVDDMSCEYCMKVDFTEHIVLDNGCHNTRAIVALSDARKEIVVAFRGTTNVWNIVLDALLINGSVKSRTNVKMHRGYYIATMSLYDEMVLAIASYLKDHPDYKVVFTGHSLGGAMAEIAAFFVQDLEQFPGVCYELYTYGTPRVGNRNFAKFMNSRTMKKARVVARADLFPHLTPTSIVGLNLLGDYYIHSQTEFWINGEEDQHFCNQNVYEDKNCSNSMGPLYSVLDHFFYFDVNLCSSFAQPLQLATLPFNLFDPVKVLPPLPKPIENLLGGILNGVGGALVGPLG